jgi:hypothetical protein
VDNKINLGETGYGGMDCNGLAKDRYQWRALVNMAMNLRVGKFSRRARLHQLIRVVTSSQYNFYEFKMIAVIPIYASNYKDERTL